MLDIDFNKSFALVDDPVRIWVTSLFLFYVFIWVGGRGGGLVDVKKSEKERR